MRKRSLLSVFLPLLFVIYYNSLLYYTIYGVSKSMTEYFCFQRRSGDPDYSNTVSGMFSMQLGNSQVGCTNPLLIAYNGTFKMFCSDGSVVDKRVVHQISETLGDMFILDYKKERDYFSLVCDIQNRNVRLSNSSYWDIDNHHIIGENGYLLNDEKTMNRFETGLGIDYNRFTCRLSKSPETCEMSRVTMDYFSILYLVFLLITVIVFFLNLTNWNGMFFRRLINRLKPDVDLKSFLDFCNPMTKKCVFLKSGSNYLHFSDNGVLISLDEQIDLFSDCESIYSVRDDHVVILPKKGGMKKIMLTKEQSDMLKSYFWTISNQCELCLLDSDKNHYLRTEEVVLGVSQGKKICISKLEMDCWALEIGVLDIEFMKAYTTLQPDMINYLLEHNFRFFSHQDMRPLIRCVKNKLGYKDRPENVKNSQWKWYCSDFCHIMKEKLGKVLKSEVNWYPSQALKSMGSDPEIVIKDDSKGVACLSSENKDDMVKLVEKDIFGDLGLYIVRGPSVLSVFPSSIGDVKIGDPSSTDIYTLVKDVEDDKDLPHKILGESMSRVKVFHENIKNYKDALLEPQKKVKLPINVKERDRYAKIVRNLNAHPNSNIYETVMKEVRIIGSPEKVVEKYERLKVNEFVRNPNITKRKEDLLKSKLLLQIELSNCYEILKIEKGCKKLIDKIKETEAAKQVVIPKERICELIAGRFKEMKTVKKGEKTKKKKKNKKKIGSKKKEKPRFILNNVERLNTFICSSLDKHLEVSSELSRNGGWVKKDDREYIRSKTLKNMSKILKSEVNAMSGSEVDVKKTKSKSKKSRSNIFFDFANAVGKTEMCDEFKELSIKSNRFISNYNEMWMEGETDLDGYLHKIEMEGLRVEAYRLICELLTLIDRDEIDI